MTGTALRTLFSNVAKLVIPAAAIYVDQKTGGQFRNIAQLISYRRSTGDSAVLEDVDPNVQLLARAVAAFNTLYNHNLSEAEAQELMWLIEKLVERDVADDNKDRKEVK